MKPHFLWVTDPWETLDHPRDTSLRLAQESLALGFESSWCDVRSIRLEGGEVLVDAWKFQEFGKDRSEKSILLSGPRSVGLAGFTSLQYRTDPPVDLAYLQPLQILGLGLGLGLRGPRAPELVNPLDVLTSGNEKIEAAALGDLLPETIAASSRTHLDLFGKKHGRAVLKPLHQAQSKGVKLLDWRTSKTAALAMRAIAKATTDFTCPALLQEFLPGIRHGEQRLWLLDGKLLANARKLPLEKDFRVNMDRGSRLAKSALNAHEKKAAVRIGAYLKKRGIRLAAVDLIDGKITDFNFTSPGLIVQMEQILERNLAKTIVMALARRK